MIDLHSHILPGVDDGPPDLDGSLRLARAAVSAGTTVIAATPHVTHAGGAQPAEIPGRVQALQAELDAAQIPLKVVQGGEIALSTVIDLTEEQLQFTRLGGGPYLLIEPPFTSALAAFEPLLYDLQVRGHRVLLAHPERCMAFHKDIERLTSLVDSGVLVQVTAGSMTGDFGETVRRVTMDFLRAGLVHVVSSDAHDDRRRPPGLVAGFYAAERELQGLSAHRQWLTLDVPQAILAGTPIPERPTTPLNPARRWSRLLRRT